jgi:hypothetical protein
MAKEHGSTLFHTLPSNQEPPLQTFLDQCGWNIKKRSQFHHFQNKTESIITYTISWQQL